MYPFSEKTSVGDPAADWSYFSRMSHFLPVECRRYVKSKGRLPTTLKNNTIRSKKLSTIVSGRKNVAPQVSQTCTRIFMVYSRKLLEETTCFQYQKFRRLLKECMNNVQIDRIIIFTWCDVSCVPKHLLTLTLILNSSEKRKKKLSIHVNVSFIIILYIITLYHRINANGIIFCFVLGHMEVAFLQFSVLKIYTIPREFLDFIKA